MTKFGVWLRKALCLGPARDLWVEKAEKDDCTPARLKVSIKNCQQFELKLVYQLNPSRKVQHYVVEVFLFFASELASSDLGFYQNLWTTVELHTPKVHISQLHLCEPGTLLGRLAEAIKAVQLSENGDKAKSENSLLQLLRLYGHTVRRSLRHESNRLQAVIQDISGELQLNGGGSVDISNMIIKLTANILRLLHNSLQIVEASKQVCRPFVDASMPQACIETWQLCDEYLMCETERALLQLLWHLQNMPELSKISDKEFGLPSYTSLQSPQRGRILASRYPLKFSDSTPEITPCLSPTQENRDIKYTEAGWPSDPIQALKEVSSRLTYAIQDLQDARQQQGYTESIIHTQAKASNEKFTNRIKVLKRNAQAANSLTPRKENPSMVLADVVGMFIAGLAMAVATLSLYAAIYWVHSTYGILYFIIGIASYILKDRIKEWGKRYLQPVAEWFGLEFPDEIVNFEDSAGQKLGQSRQFCSVKEDTDVEKRVLQMRWGDSQQIPTQRHATNPEKVLVYKKRMSVHWDHMDQNLQAVSGLDDVMRWDISQFCRCWANYCIYRRMVEPEERHIRLVPGNEPGIFPKMKAEKVTCLREYHFNLVMRVMSTKNGTSDDHHTSKTMHLQRVRLVANQNGILRLEEGGHIPMEKTAHRLPRHIARKSVQALSKPFASRSQSTKDVRVTIGP